MILLSWLVRWITAEHRSATYSIRMLKRQYEAELDAKRDGYLFEKIPDEHPMWDMM